MTEHEEYLKAESDIRNNFRMYGNRNDLPNDEGLRQLKEYYGAILLEYYKYNFLKHFGNCWIIKGIKDSIKDLEIFIENAETKNLQRAFNAGLEGNIDTEEYCYLRLKNDYYSIPEHRFKIADLCENSPLVTIYARYFLFYNFLKDKLKELEQQEQGVNLLENDSVSQEMKKTVMQYALYYHYLIETGVRQRFENDGGKLIAIKKIADKHGISKNTLQQNYNKIYRKKDERCIGTPQNLTDLEIVISMLTDYPKAEELARNEFEQAQKNGDKSGNPVI